MNNNTTPKKYIYREYDDHLKEEYLEDIKNLPELLRVAVAKLDRNDEDCSYRVGGWTLKQVTHHLADSHINGYVRCKLILTEENPTIKTYLQNEWATLNDISQTDINDSVLLLESLHKRWYHSLVLLTKEQFLRPFVHPENPDAKTLWFLVGLYAWHGKHHVSQIVNFKKEQMREK